MMTLMLSVLDEVVDGMSISLAGVSGAGGGGTWGAERLRGGGSSDAPARAQRGAWEGQEPAPPTAVSLTMAPATSSAL